MAQEQFGGDLGHPAELHAGDGYPRQNVQVFWMHITEH